MFLAATQWSVWGECSVTCGGGIQSRTRDCSSGNQAECPPGTIYSEQRDCNDDPCPIGKFNPVKWVTVKGQLNSEWIYEIIVSPKIPTKIYRDFCPTL